jgi:hypothetical protein
MTFPHSLTGRVRSNFTFSLLKNGEQVMDIEIEIRESPSSIYTASFVNDGDDHALWTLVIQDIAVDDVFYVETWEVRKLVVEDNVKQIRTRLDSDGGFVGGGSES